MNKPGLSTEAVLETPFRIDLISQAAAPDGSDTVWQRYVISQGNNRIEGLRAGARADVVMQVENMVARLNERLGKLRPKNK